MTRLKVDGGMVVNELLMQFQADVLGVPVIRPKVSETTCLGAAYAAGLAVGFWRDTKHLAEKLGRGQKPGGQTWSRAVLEKGYAGWQKAVERTLNWIE